MKRKKSALGEATELAASLKDLLTQLRTGPESPAGRLRQELQQLTDQLWRFQLRSLHSRPSQVALVLRQIVELRRKLRSCSSPDRTPEG